MLDVWIWQMIVSPHMAPLAAALARLGCKVTYVAERTMSDDRAADGWAAPELPGVNLEFACDDVAVQRLVQSAAADSIHICQGIRANKLVAVAQRALSARSLQQWVVMETVDDSGFRGIVKRFEYGRLLKARRNCLEGVLATGYRTANWVVARGVPSQSVFPFAYFLPAPTLVAETTPRPSGPFRFIYVGRMISSKRVDWLIDALATLEEGSFELWLVGTGNVEPELRELARNILGSHVRWFGGLPIAQVQSVMAQADCLVLPSVHDGWGAVVSESLMVGTPAICSDACGVAGVVKASGMGGVFSAKDRLALQKILAAQLGKGIVCEATRTKLKNWASCLGCDAGAKYLQRILMSRMDPQCSKVVPPWCAAVNGSK